MPSPDGPTIDAGHCAMCSMIGHLCQRDDGSCMGLLPGCEGRLGALGLAE
jgi:hypothetical protein